MSKNNVDPCVSIGDTVNMHRICQMFWTDQMYMYLAIWEEAIWLQFARIFWRSIWNGQQGSITTCTANDFPDRHKHCRWESFVLLLIYLRGLFDHANFMLGSCANHWNPAAAMDGKTPQVPERMVELHTEKQEVLDVDDCGQATHKAQGPKKSKTALCLFYFCQIFWHVFWLSWGANVHHISEHESEDI